MKSETDAKQQKKEFYKLYIYIYITFLHIVQYKLRN